MSRSTRLTRRREQPNSMDESAKEKWISGSLLLRGDFRLSVVNTNCQIALAGSHRSEGSVSFSVEIGEGVGSV
jgi:hypothetical protein